MGELNSHLPPVNHHAFVGRFSEGDNTGWGNTLMFFLGATQALSPPVRFSGAPMLLPYLCHAAFAGSLLQVGLEGFEPSGAGN